jgi:hypothetical protein
MKLLVPLLALTLALSSHAQATWNGELRAHVEQPQANARGPLGEAQRLQPGIAAPQRDALVLEAGLRGQTRHFSADVYLRQQRFEGGAHEQDARVNELYASDDAPAALLGEGAAWSAGKKVVSWDVGYGFRPNDVVAQEPRRPLLPVRPEGRPLLQIESFGTDSAWTLVWTNPQQLHARVEDSRHGAESALALRAYRRAGAVDGYGFLRLGAHTRGSAGAAVAWVASEAVELHASARWMHRHDGFTFNPAGGALAPPNPWREATLGAASQWLLGATWASAEQLSLLAELWHDGSAPPDAAWDAWGARNAALSALAASPALRPAAAGNLAWQATPWSRATSLRRDNALLRLTWQHAGWEPVLELLLTPRDRGRSLTAALAWQGDRWRLEGGFRRYGGPDAAVLAQLPVRQTGYLAATLAF